MSYKFSQRSLDRMDGVHPDLIAVAHRALEITVIDFGIPPDGGFRSTQDQQRLFTKGVTKADGVRNISKHQEGRAIDVYAYVDGEASWEIDHLALIAAAVLQAAAELGIKLRWGGLWGGGPYEPGFTDMPHFELAPTS